MKKKFRDISISIFSSSDYINENLFNTNKTERKVLNKDQQIKLTSFLDNEKEKTDKNKYKTILTDSSVNINSHSILNRPIQVSTHKTRKISASNQNEKTLTQKRPYLKKTPKFSNHFKDKTRPNFYNKTIRRSNNLKNSQNYINNICLTDNSIEKKNEYLLLDDRNNDYDYSKSSKNSDLTHSKNNFMKVLCESFNIISNSHNCNDDNNNEKDKFLKKIELLEEKIKELIQEKEKINDINNIIIRDNKQLESKIKKFNETYNNLYIQKQLDILYEQYDSSNKIIDISKVKLFFILQQKFDRKILDNKLLLLKYFQKLFLYSKLKDIGSNKQGNFIISNNESFIINKIINKSYSNSDINPRNTLLTSIINKKKLERYIFVNNFEKWKFKSKILKTINFVKEKKRKKREKSKQKKQKKLGENNEENALDKQNNNTNNINCYDENKEDDLWNEYGSEYSDEEEKDEDNKINSIKSKSYKKDNNGRQSRYANYYKY